MFVNIFQQMCRKIVISMVTSMQRNILLPQKENVYMHAYKHMCKHMRIKMLINICIHICIRLIINICIHMRIKRVITWLEMHCSIKEM